MTPIPKGGNFGVSLNIISLRQTVLGCGHFGDLVKNLMLIFITCSTLLLHIGQIEVIIVSKLFDDP